MSESDTMFNKQDQRCTTVQHMLSTDPSYDNRTIASSLKMQIWMVQCLRAQLNTLDDPLEVMEWKDSTRKTQTKEFIEKVQAFIDENPQRPLRQIAWDLGVSHTTVNACVKEDLKCRSYRCQISQILTDWEDKEPQANQVRLPHPRTWTYWTTSFSHTFRTSPTWPPTIPKPTWSPPSAEYSPSSRQCS